MAVKWPAVELAGSVMRVPLVAATACAAIGMAATAAVTHEYALFPAVRPFAWASPLAVFFVFGYLAGAVLVGGWACVVAVVGRRAEAAGSAVPRTPRETVAGRPAQESVGRFGRLALNPMPGVGVAGEALAALWARPRVRHGAAAVVLAMVVLAEGGTHLGADSGSWATSVPRSERYERTADGYVVWLEGTPVQEDSSTFIQALGVMSGREPAEAITGYARSGRTAYTFLVGLAAPLTGVLGSVYAAFVAVNLVLWWGAAMALYDLGRRALRSWWAGLAAGVLVATGLGFTYMVGNAMSAAAAYGAVAVVLWAMERLRVFTGRSPWTDDALTGFLAAGAGLLNSLAPFFLVFGALFYAGRAELRRLLLWAVLVVGVGEAWGRVLVWTGRPPSTPAQGDDVLVALAIVGAVVALAVLARTPGWFGERVVAGGVIALAAGAVALARLAPDRVYGVLDVALSGLHIPDYLSGPGAVLARLGGGTGGSDRAAVLELVRRNAMDLNVLAAFPWPVLVLAGIGLWRMPRRWLSWCAAVIVSAFLVTLLMNAVTNAPHPRLAYVAFPGVILLAAHGLQNVHRYALRIAGGASGAGAGLRVAAATALVLVCVGAAVAPSNASLWGNRFYDDAFHFLPGR